MSNIPYSVHQKIKKCQEKQLPTLDLSDLNLIHIPSKVFSLIHLKELNLRWNKLNSLSPEIGQLKNLISLDLRLNHLNTLPPEIGQLTSLTSLYLSFNNLSSLPPEIGQLTSLTSLDLSNNNLRSLLPEIGQLTSLTSLYLSFNNLSSLPPEIGQLTSLTLLYLADNKIQNPPPEVLNLNKHGQADLERIKTYFRQRQAEGTTYLYEAKLLIVGEGGAGKTTLANKIQDAEYELQDEDTTKGIEVNQFFFDVPLDIQQAAWAKANNTAFAPADKAPQFQVNIWDFGGQEIYHTTHQFFLTKRSLYLLVADTRKEDTDFYYWLNVIELLSDNSPVIIIKNEKQDRQRDINLRQLRGQFTNLEKSLATNLATNRGLLEVLAQIKHDITHLPHIGDALPTTWVKVRQALEADSRSYIDLKEYFVICEQNGFKRRDYMLQLSGYLHDLGVCLHFQDDDLLKKTVILKPEWGTAAVYKVLDNIQVVNNKGQFSPTDLKNIWHEAKYQDMHTELLRLMTKFKLCYQLKHSPDYIAPQLLSNDQPDYPWPSNQHTLLLRYHYHFMPKGILSQFIVATHRFIKDQAYVWRSGVILEKDNTQAEVIEHYGHRQIAIRIVGKHKRDLLTIIMHELDEIHNAYKRLKYDKQIPCNCRECANQAEPFFFPYKVLHRARDAGEDSLKCHNSFQEVSVRRLLDDVFGGDTEGFNDPIIQNHYRRLQKLKEQQALIGYDVAPKIKLEIEDIEQEIKSLQSKKGYG